ncbi:starvation-inducible DNA-binding protein [Maritalea mobilis]|uniref:Starvation-inducible DNA-binding protein n=1 Tax=Maritalea mobilis TaxID=483324 RepID=A0A4R6VUD6_9HYPH|nr:DNA starvation/stationary phase protection protein [Maritalea mobilis]TDQ67091.1 starvation-inducible DNA-binding protein [Maritalea mobilis]
MSNVSSIMNAKSTSEDINTGLDEGLRKDISKTLSDVLGASYRLMIKSHVYHWNVVGPLFKPLHELTEEHYEDLFAAIDVIAERVRALGNVAPYTIGNASEFAPDGKEVEHLTAIDMVDDLIAEHEAICRKMREAAEKAGDNKDMVTEDLMTERLAFHEKAIWMLRATASE